MVLYIIFKLRARNEGEKMNIVAIIAEYNPMHNGHILNIQKAKELSLADYALSVMSGSFTELGNVACFNKFMRSKCALENGLDMVIELPQIYALSSAEDFATGAINILNNTGIVTHLAFGAETDNLDLLLNIAKIHIKNKDEILEKVKEISNSGTSFASALDFVIKEYLTDEEYKEFSKPNNILAIEYLKALIRSKSKIKPVLIKRELSFHNDQKLCLNSKFASSTAIREVLSLEELSLNEKIDILKNSVPDNTLNLIKNYSYNTNENLFNILKYEVLKLGKSGLKDILDVCEGLENKLYNEIANSTSYNEYIFNVKSKRYTLARIKRICAYIILGITKEKKERLKNTRYVRILKISKEKKDLLSYLNANSKIPVISKFTDYITNSKDICESIELDVLANNIAFNFNEDYTNNIIKELPNI